ALHHAADSGRQRAGDRRRLLGDAAYDLSTRLRIGKVSESCGRSLRQRSLAEDVHLALLADPAGPGIGKRLYLWRAVYAVTVGDAGAVPGLAVPSGGLSGLRQLRAVPALAADLCQLADQVADPALWRPAGLSARPALLYRPDPGRVQRRVSAHHPGSGLRPAPA